MMSLPIVRSTSLGGMQPNMLPVMKWGVTTAWFHCRASGLSTLMSRPSRTLTRFSSCSLALSTVFKGLGPVIPLMGESRGTFAFDAGSEGGMQQLSALPTITCLSGSKSFHEFTIFIFSPPKIMYYYFWVLKNPFQRIYIFQGTGYMPCYHPNSPTPHGISLIKYAHD